MLHKRKSKSTMSLQHTEHNVATEDDWKNVQNKSFRRWCNQQLKEKGVELVDLTDDIKDGTKLIKLVEVLTETKIGRYNKNPKLRPQKLENVQQALDLISKEKIKLIGVGPSDIVDGNSKLVLGLIWTLIQHYQINQAVRKAGIVGNVKGLSPKQALLKWLQSKLNEHPIGPPVNLTSDWADGRRIAALCDVLAPGSFPHAERISQENIFQNLADSIEAANIHLGVPRLLSPEDMLASKIDERSMMIYLSEFLQAQPIKLSNGVAPSAPPAQPKPHENIQVYGPGLEEGVIVGKVSEFYIQPSVPSPQQPLKVHLSGPTGNRLDVCVTPDSDKGVITCSFQPLESGTHEVNIESENGEVPPSRYTVTVLPSENGSNEGESATVRAYGPGVDGGNLYLEHPCPFTVDTGDLEGQLSIEVTGPNGPLIDSDLNVNMIDDGKFDVVYVPSVPGNYLTEVTFNGDPIAGNPFTVVVSDKSGDSSLVSVYGDGLTGGLINEALTFTIDTREAGHGSIDMAIEGPSKCEADYQDHGDGSCDVTYFPIEMGAYKIIIQFDHQDVPGSPFTANAVDASKAVASGPGLSLEPSLVGERALIYLDVEKSGRCEVECRTQETDGTVTKVLFDTLDEVTLSGSYIPSKPGIYQIDISMYGVAVHGSPFSVPVIDLSAVSVTGEGLKIGIVGGDNVIEVKTAGAGPGELKVLMLENQNKKNVNIALVPKSETRYQLLYSPSRPGLYSLQVGYSGVPLDPYLIRVIDPKAVEMEGPGLAAELPTKTLTYFTVNHSKTGCDEAIVRIDSKDSKSKVRLTKEKVSKYVYKYSYQLTDPKIYQISVLLDGESATNPPIRVAGIDQSSIKLYGEGLDGCIVSERGEFFIDTRHAGDGSIGLALEGPAETPVECTEVEEGVYKVCYTPTTPGLFNLNVNFSEKPVEGSPFQIPVTRGPPDASRVKAINLEAPGRFIVDARSAGGSGLLQVGVTGRFYPAEFISVKHNGDFTFAVTYDLLETEDLTISVKWHGVEIENSPFTVNL